MDAVSEYPFRKIEFHPARKPYKVFTTDFHVETLNPSVENVEAPKNSRSELSVNKGQASVFPDNGLDPELSFGITFRRIGAGLQNLGNTCFLNSVLQCLTYTEPLAAYLQSGKHQNSCRTAGFCALCALQRHVSRALQSTGRILAPKDLVSNLRCISRNFRNSRQEDAHEYMVNLLESMHKCCLPSGVPSESPTAYEKSLVHKIFGGQLRSQVKCMQCSFCSDKFDPFLDLSLEIMKADTLHKALAHFTAKEQLDGGERQYQCQRCKQKVKAIKQLTVHKAPQVLAVHLKRFGSRTGSKIDKQIQFGSILDLKPFVSGYYDGDLKYTLYGVLVHAGWSTHSGHYFCFVRTSSGIWYFLDDNRVTQVGERKVLDQKAYMLFYVLDRKNIALKKSLGITQKNAEVKAMGNGAETNDKATNGTIQSIPIESVINARNSVAMASGGSSHVPKVILTNGVCRSKNIDLMRKLPDKLFEKNLARKELDDSKVAKRCAESADLPNSSGNSITKKDLNDNTPVYQKCNGHASFIADEKLIRSIVAPPNFIEESTKEDFDFSTMPSNVSSITQASNEDSCIMDQKILAKMAVETSEKGPEEMPGGVVDPVRSSCNLKDAKIGDSLMCADKFSGKDEIQSENDLWHQQIGDHLFSKRKFLCSKPLHKPNKKLLKCQVTGIHLGSNMLVRASLGMWKKKKQKLHKKHALEKKLSRQLSRTDFAQIDIGPSSSFEMNGLVQLLTKDINAAVNKKNDIIDVVTESGRDLSISQVNNSNELLVEEQTQNDNRTASRGHSSVEKSCSSLERGGVARQNDLINVLTLGSEETTVACWDGIKSHSFQAAESNYTNTSIGYIGDEWDEEYDRGKRKKVRNSKTSFGGPNLFQEIATRKEATKKQKMCNFSESQPFRI